MKSSLKTRGLCAIGGLAISCVLATAAQQRGPDPPPETRHAVAGAAAGMPSAAAAADLPPWSGPPTDRQIRALVARVTENQHADDAAMAEYERKERIVSHGGGKNPWMSERLNVVVPAGVRIVRVQLEKDYVPLDPPERERQWHEAAQALIRETHTEDPDVRQNDDREVRRAHQRYEMVEVVGKAFQFTWMGRRYENGRNLVEFSFEPNPAFHSSSLYAIVYAHTAGTVWVDEASCQVVRINARLKDDLSIGGGLVAKVYRGASATLQQDEVEPGVWEPTHYTFDFEGRKFLFSALSGHEQGETSEYRWLGPLEQALATIQREHPAAP